MEVRKDLVQSIPSKLWNNWLYYGCSLLSVMQGLAMELSVWPSTYIFIQTPRGYALCNWAKHRKTYYPSFSRWLVVLCHCVCVHTRLQNNKILDEWYCSVYRSRRRFRGFLKAGLHQAPAFYSSSCHQCGRNYGKKKTRTVFPHFDRLPSISSSERNWSLFLELLCCKVDVGPVSRSSRSISNLQSRKHIITC